MAIHPVQLHVDRVTHIPRVEVAIRVVLVVALGLLGWSSIYWLVYLALPAVVALYLVQKGPETYLGSDAPRVVRALRWLTSAYAYLFFLSDVLPTAEGNPAELHVSIEGRP